MRSGLLYLADKVDKVRIGEPFSELLRVTGVLGTPTERQLQTTRASRVPSRTSFVRAISVTDAPTFPNHRATHAPAPPEAPVTITTGFCPSRTRTRRPGTDLLKIRGHFYHKLMFLQGAWQVFLQHSIIENERLGNAENVVF